MRPVLVADDSPVVRRVVSARLRAAGLAVREAECAADCADVRAEEIACAVLDLDLGDGDGLDVAAQLRAQDPVFPLAFFSSGGTESAAARARAFGPLFTKPDEVDGVIAWVVARIG